jgi:predicted transcriptional regulator
MARLLRVRQPSVNRYLKAQVPDPQIMQRLIEGQVTANDFFKMPKRRKRKVS